MGATTIDPKAGIGAWQTLLRTPLVDTGRLPKNTAGRGLKSALRPPIFEEGEPQVEEKSENDLRMSQAGRADGLRDGISRTGLG